jgi:hypothetical protein
VDRAVVVHDENLAVDIGWRVHHGSHLLLSPQSGRIMG